jgi:ATP-dependent helicase/nuclease subunit B
MWTRSPPWGFRRELLRVNDDESDPLPARLIETSRIDAVRRGVVDKLQPFVLAMRTTQPLPLRTRVAELQQLLDRFGVQHALSDWMRQADRAGKLELRGEHQQVWTELLDLFQQMADLLGDEPTTLADFIAVLDSGLEGFDLALTPPTVDQILVGQIDRTRTPPNLKRVFVLGLNDGQFPRVDREGCVLSDRERRTLRKRHIELDPETDRRLLDERFLAYLAFTRGSQQLVVSRCLTVDGSHAANPSLYWLELRRLFPQAPVTHVSRANQGDPLQIGTPRQLVTALMRWARDGAGTTKANSLWPPLYHWLATHERRDRAIDLMRYRAWKALAYTNDAALSGELTSQLFPSPLNATVARLETFAACPFKHFVRYGLQLEDRDEPDVTAIDLSNAYHRVLEQLLRDILETKQDWCEMPTATAAELIATHVAEVGRTLRNELMLSTARNRYLLDHIERTLQLAVESQREMHRRGKYRPRLAPLRFGDEDGANLPAHAIKTPHGKELRLHGQIDRVDLHANGAAFTVADYKLGAAPLALDRVYYGLSLQLLAYLLVVQAGGPQLAGRKLSPAAGFLLQLLRSPQTVDHPDEAMAPDHPDFHLRIKPRGIIDARAIHSLDAGTAEGSSPVVNFFLKKDGQLGKRAFTDVADQSEFAALLKLVERRLGEIADQILAGNVHIAPYWMNRQTPCPRCAYRSVCRFEPGINRYRMLQPMKRDELLAKVASREEHSR